MIFTEAPEINPTLRLDDLPGTFGDALGESAQSALYNSPVAQLYRTWEDTKASGPKLDYETARTRAQEAGVDIQIDPQGMSEGALNLLIERKRAIAKTQDALARGPGGFAAGSAYFLTGLGAAMLDPINLATAFIPVARLVGMEGQIARAGMRGAEGAALTATGRAAARIRVGAVEGAAGQAMVEPLTAYRADQEQEDYTITDTLLNIGFGTVLGSVAHTGLGALGDRAVGVQRNATAKSLIDAAKTAPDSAAAKLQTADMETVAATFRAEVAAAADGRVMDTSVLVAEAAPVVRDLPELPKGREGYDTPVEIDAAKLKEVLEQNMDEPLVSKPEKLQAWRDGTARTDPVAMPVELALGRDGSVAVNDGRHRIALAAERGEKVQVYINGEDVPRLKEQLGDTPKSTDPTKVQSAAAASHLPENDVHFDAAAKAEVDEAVAMQAEGADPAEAVTRAIQEAQTELDTLSKQMGLDPEKNAAMRGADELASTASRYSKAIEAFASCQVRT